jgi:hypothetical protein
VLKQRRQESRAEVVDEPAGAELVIVHDARRRLGELRNDHRAGDDRQ